MLKSHFSVRKAVLSVCIAAALTNLCHAGDISVVGLFPGKAVLVIDGALPKTYSVGTTIDPSTRLVSVDAESATLEVNGKRQVLGIGQHVNRNAPKGAASFKVVADSRGHFVINGQINGGTVRLLIDTGATMITLSSTDAHRLGIDYKKGTIGTANTANGPITVYRVMLDSVKIGDIELSQVEGLVQEAGLEVGLLGMSFLNRTDMHRKGNSMTLTKRY